RGAGTLAARQGGERLETQRQLALQGVALLLQRQAVSAMLLGAVLARALQQQVGQTPPLLQQLLCQGAALRVGMGQQDGATLQQSRRAGSAAVEGAGQQLQTLRRGQFGRGGAQEDLEV